MPRAQAAVVGRHSQVGAIASAFNNGRHDNEPGARWMGKRRTGNPAWLNCEGVMELRNASRRRRQQRFVGPTNIVGTAPQQRTSEAAVAAQVSVLLDHLTPEAAADIAARNPETARQWKKATRAPNSSSLLALGASIPSVGDWIVAQLGRDTGASGVLDNPQMLGVILSGLQQVAMKGGVEGTIARKLISQLTGVSV